MAKGLLIVWYTTLILSIVEVIAYGLTGYVASGYRAILWHRFNQSVQIFHDVDEKTPYAESINRYAREAGISPQIVESIIQAESSFQPRSVSKAGAYGLMQIMPATWRQVNEDRKICNSRHQGECTSECYYNGDLNIQIGTLYLAKLVKKYQGNMILALAAYNAGPGTVDYYKDIPPYPETMIYTEKVVKYYYSIRNEEIFYPSMFAMKTWDKIRQCIGWCLSMTILLMTWVIWKLVRLQSSWYWR